MLQIRIVYEDNKVGNQNLDRLISLLEKEATIVNHTGGEGNGMVQYDCVYLDVKLKE